MNRQIRDLLVQRGGYSLHSAEITSTDLANLKQSDIRKALIDWITSGVETNIIRKPFSSQQLMADFCMKYPATLIFLDWYCDDPASAIASLNNQGG